MIDKDKYVEGRNKPDSSPQGPANKRPSFFISINPIWQKLLVISLVITIHFSGWLIMNRPYSLINWNGVAVALCFNVEKQENQPPITEIERLIANTAKIARGIRLYSSAPIDDKITAIAKKYGLTVMAGAWLDKDIDNNQPY